MASPPRVAIHVAIAETNPLLRRGLANLFAEDDRFQPAVTAGGEDFLELVEHEPFDVGIIGWEMPCRGGQAVLRALRGRAGSPKVVVYTGCADPNLPRQAMMLGAAAFCSKRDPPQQLLSTVLVVAAGRMAFPRLDLSKLPPDPVTELSCRERDLLARLADGLTNQEIANQVGLSLNMVKFHIRTLYDRIRVRNRAQAVAFYLQEGRRRY